MKDWLADVNYEQHYYCNCFYRARGLGWLSVFKKALAFQLTPPVSEISNRETTQQPLTSASSTQRQKSSRRNPFISQVQAREILNSIYKGDYRTAFVQKQPELFLKHIPDDFKSISIEGNEYDAKALRQGFRQRFTNQVRTIEHNVTVESVSVMPDGAISAVVTLYTLEEFKRVKGGNTYLVTTIGTYNDRWQNRQGTWFEIGGNQLRNQVITAPRP